MTNDERMDEIIRGAAASEYNRAPATPKDEMWNAIQAARAGAGPQLHVISGGPSKATTDVGYSAPRRFSQRFAWVGMAAAAALLVATGIGIGRWTGEPDTDPARSAPIAKVADAPRDVPSTVNEVGPSPVEPSTTAGGSAPAQPSKQPARRTPEQIRNNPQIIGSGKVTPLRVPAGGALASNDPAPLTGMGPTAVNTTYQVATLRHLADAEALLTSFSLGSRDARMDAQFAQWAKGLLSNTRLLLDSPAGEDPRRAKLLQDLELVLAQIVQLAPNAAAQERELIEGGIQEGHVMTRLRTAIPAGQPRGILER